MLFMHLNVSVTWKNIMELFLPILKIPLL